MASSASCAVSKPSIEPTSKLGHTLQGGKGGRGGGGDGEDGGGFNLREWSAKFLRDLGGGAKSLLQTVAALLLLLSVFYAASFVRPLSAAALNAVRYILRLDGRGARRVRLPACLPLCYLPLQTNEWNFSILRYSDLLTARETVVQCAIIA